jgi:hypothetical protein
MMERTAPAANNCKEDASRLKTCRDRLNWKLAFMSKRATDFFLLNAGSNITKTTLYILAILLSGDIFAQTKKAEDIGFRHIQTIYQGDTSL